MAEVKLFSTSKRLLKPLVGAALHNELGLLQSGIRRAEDKLRELEAQYSMSTEEFIRRYENNEMKETLQLAEWIGECRLLERLREKADTLQEIQIAD